MPKRKTVSAQRSASQESISISIDADELESSPMSPLASSSKRRKRSTDVSRVTTPTRSEEPLSILEEKLIVPQTIVEELNDSKQDQLTEGEKPPEDDVEISKSSAVEDKDDQMNVDMKETVPEHVPNADQLVSDRLKNTKAIKDEKDGAVDFRVVENDGQDESMILLTGLKNIFQKQLPNMPKEYIARLVYDK